MQRHRAARSCGFQLDLFAGDMGIGPLLNGVHLAANRNVVVVTINYRLAALGFLAHPSLAAESAEGVSGNYGLMDMIAALKWVQTNIAKFGGDPKKVMIFGHSAGAAATCCIVGLSAGEGIVFFGRHSERLVWGRPHGGPARGWS